MQCEFETEQNTEISNEPAVADNSPNEPKYRYLKEKYEALEKKYKLVKKNFNIVQNRIRNTRSNQGKNKILAEKIRAQGAMLRKLQKKNRILAKEKTKNRAVLEGLPKLFSENQLKLISGHQKRVRWTAEDMHKAFTLRYLSKRAYMFLRDSLHYPIPGNKQCNYIYKLNKF